MSQPRSVGRGDREGLRNESPAQLRTAWGGWPVARLGYVTTDRPSESGAVIFFFVILRDVDPK